MIPIVRPFAVDDGNLVVVRNVPMYECSQCGDLSMDNEVLVRIERVITQFRASGATVTIGFYESG